MNTKTFKKEDIRNAVYRDTDENSPLVLEHAEKWESEGKFQYQENILKEISTGLYYSFTLTRSGSHFSEYTYSFEWARDEIKLVQVANIYQVTRVWVAIELGEVNVAGK